MGTLVGHLVPGLTLILLGLWHTVNTIRAYALKGSSNFTVKFWHPFNSPFPNLKYLELILILTFCVLAVFMQVVDFPFIQLSFELDNFEHASMFLHLAIFAGFTLSAELTHSLQSLSGVSGILVASVFAQELFLLHFHSTDHVGLEGHYHWLLQLIVFVCLVAALAATNFPTSFPAALTLSAAVVFQGCWFINMGFMIWVPEFVPKGCRVQSTDSGHDSMHSAVACGSNEADLRARALANMQFSWILSGILMLVGSLCLKMVGRCSSKVESLEYEQLDSTVRDVPVVIDDFKEDAVSVPTYKNRCTP